MSSTATRQRVLKINACHGSSTTSSFYLSIIPITLTAYWFAGHAIFTADCFAYAEVAQEALQGEKMYEECWQDKPPLATLFYLPPQLVMPGSAKALQLWLGLWLVLQAIVVA